MKWSKEQQQAINESGQNILVSAGAGSGKTAVLTERLKQKVLSGIHLEELIVLTFTNDAAKEMKERLRSALKKEYTLTNNQIIKEELAKIDTAHIQTFDSFTSFIVKKYHYLLNVPKQINVMDNNLLDIKIHEFTTDIIEKLFNENDPNILLLANDYTIKDSKKIVEIVCDMINALELVIDIDNYLDNYFNIYYNDEYFEKVNNFLNKRVNNLLKKLADIWNNPIELKDPKLKEHFGDCKDKVRKLINIYENKKIDLKLINEALEIKFDRLPPKGDKEEKQYISLVKDESKKIISKLELVSKKSFEEVKNDILKTKPYIKSIIKIIKKVLIKINQYKEETSSYTFMDISKMAIKVLKENKNICDEIKYHTKEILIDEYQDTSDVQEALLSLIENNNTYMVGDIKQSIYRFRNANPKIFKDKYLNYKNQNGGIVIDLMKNFRSRKEVLSDINLIFEDLMDIDYGGVYYNQGHRLIFGNESFLKFENELYNMDIYKYDKSAFNDFTTAEIEAFIIGRDILKKVGNIKIYNPKEEFPRVAKFSDFAILTNSTSCFDTYERIFTYLGIPLSKSSKSSFIRSEEIYFVRSILECAYSLIDNKFYQEKFKKSLLSLLRSFVLEIDDNVIHEIFTNSDKIDLKNYLPKLYQQLINVSNILVNTNIYNAIDYIYEEFDIYANLIKLGNIEERQTKLHYLANMSKTINNLTIEEFLNYLIEIEKNEEIDIEFTPIQDNANCVRITSIHKSKGLEYPICYLADIKREFNERSIRSKTLFSDEFGMILPYFNDGLNETILKTIFTEDYHKEEVSEKIRLFYVALTRAKEKLIFIMPTVEESKKGSIHEKEKFKSFLNFMDSISDKLMRNTLYIDLNNYDISKKYLYNSSKKIPGYDNFHANNKIYLENKIYQKKEHNATFNKRASKTIKNILTKEELNNIEKGLKFHEILEFNSINIKNYNDLSNVNYYVKKFIENDFIKSLDIINEYHEYQYIINNQKYIIDLIIETNDILYIVDYKLKNIHDSEYVNQLLKYQDYLLTITNKKVEVYLYSIIDNEFSQINSNICKK